MVLKDEKVEPSEILWVEKGNYLQGSNASKTLQNTLQEFFNKTWKVLLKGV